MLVTKLLRGSTILGLNKLIRKTSNYKRSLVVTNPSDNSLRDIITDFAKKNSKTKSDFGELRKELLLNKKSLTEINVDYFIISVLSSTNDLHLVENYIEYLKNNDLEVKTPVLGCLLKLYNNYYECGKLTADKHVNILNIYKEILEKYDNLDASTCENLIFGLVCTSDWKKSLELLQITKLSAKPSNNVYSLIISKAFENATDNELGWTLLHEMVNEYKKQPNCKIFISILKSIQNEADYTKQIETLNRLLSFIGEHDIVISKLVTNELTKTLDSMNLKNSQTQISFNGKCENCNLFLERVFISNDEFKLMRNTFLDRAIIHKDVFLKTNPKELENFLKYIDKHAPFHCVVDGLNVAYSINGKLSPVAVCSVVKYFKDLNMNILLIGRKHMTRWPNEHFGYIKKNCKMFLTDNLSQDDPFLLYAALKSGPSTHIFSKDLMRSHSYLLGDNLKLIFKRWLQEHLYSLIKVKKNGKILVKEPCKFNINAHKVEETWHLPFTENYQANPKDSYEVPQNWLCIKLPNLNK
ncbi:mitochondrial ribonuclease P catalytic subunit [Condylostylus longicornis]|uniref:mitochondrial ribonuclease P catalytic subunit n=1 Tax=Condylostylus longicornis TaxID=2530218 RepID=UPI00244DAFC9|nr:mitochondrial ribonuclease P catalytic subunit [Condylostylus longicornis]